MRACFYDGSSAETAYFVKAFPYNGGPAQGNFAPYDPSWNNYICRDITVSRGQYYHIAVYSYTSRTGQFSVPADSINTYWIYVS